MIVNNWLEIEINATHELYNKKKEVSLFLMQLHLLNLLLLQKSVENNLLLYQLDICLDLLECALFIPTNAKILVESMIHLLENIQSTVKKKKKRKTDFPQYYKLSDAVCMCVGVTIV